MDEDSFKQVGTIYNMYRKRLDVKDHVCINFSSVYQLHML